MEGNGEEKQEKAQRSEVGGQRGRTGKTQDGKRVKPHSLGRTLAGTQAVRADRFGKSGPRDLFDFKRFPPSRFNQQTFPLSPITTRNGTPSCSRFKPPSQNPRIAVARSAVPLPLASTSAAGYNRRFSRRLSAAHAQHCRTLQAALRSSRNGIASYVLFPCPRVRQDVFRAVNSEQERQSLRPMEAEDNAFWSGMPLNRIALEPLVPFRTVSFNSTRAHPHSHFCMARASAFKFRPVFEQRSQVDWSLA